MKKHIFSLLQRIGQSFMLPIALLPIAGIFLGIGSSLTNTNMLAAYHLKGLMGPGTAPYILFSLLNSAGSIIFDNLPILFAVGVAIGMARTEKATAALSSIVAFFVMHSTIGSLITYTGRSHSFLTGATTEIVGITSLQMGVALPHCITVFTKLNCPGFFRFLAEHILSRSSAQSLMSASVFLCSISGRRSRF